MQQGQAPTSTPPQQLSLPPIPSGAAPPHLAPQIPEPGLPEDMGQNIPAPTQGPLPFFHELLPSVPGGPIEPPVALPPPDVTLPADTRSLTTEELLKSLDSTPPLPPDVTPQPDVTPPKDPYTSEREADEDRAVKAALAEENALLFLSSNPDFENIVGQYSRGELNESETWEQYRTLMLSALDRGDWSDSKVYQTDKVFRNAMEAAALERSPSPSLEEEEEAWKRFEEKDEVPPAKGEVPSAKDAVPLNELFFPKKKKARRRAGTHGAKGEKGREGGEGTQGKQDTLIGAETQRMLEKHFPESVFSSGAFIPGGNPALAAEDLRGLLNLGGDKPKGGKKPQAGDPYPKHSNLVYHEWQPEKDTWSLKPAAGYTWDEPNGRLAVKPIPKESEFKGSGIGGLDVLADLGAEDSNALLNLYELDDESNFARLAQDLVARGLADSVQQVIEVVAKEYEAKQEEDAVEGLKEMGIELEEDLPKKNRARRKKKKARRRAGPHGATGDPSNIDIKKWTRARVEQELNIKAPPKPAPLNPIETLIWEAREKYGGLVEDSSTKSTYDRIDERLKNIRSYPEEVLDYNIKLTQMAKSLFELQDLQKAPTKPKDLLKEVNKLHGLAKGSGLEMNMTYREGKLTIGFPSLGTKGQDLVPTWYDHIDPKTEVVTRKLLEFDGKVVMRDIRTNKYLYVDTENKILSAAGPTPSYVLTQLNQSEEKLYQILAAKVHLIDNDKKDINTHTFLDILQRPDGWFKNPKIRGHMEGATMVGNVDTNGWSAGQGKWELKITPPKSAGKGALPYFLNIQVYEWDDAAKAVKTEEFTDSAGRKTLRPVMNPQFETAMEKALEAAKHFDMFTNILPTMLRQNLGFPAHDSTGGQRQIKDREAIESGLNTLFK